MSFFHTIKSFSELKKLVHVLEVLESTEKTRKLVAGGTRKFNFGHLCFEQESVEMISNNEYISFFCSSFEQWIYSQSTLMCRKVVAYIRNFTDFNLIFGFFSIKNEFPEIVLVASRKNSNHYCSESGNWNRKSWYITFYL